MLMRRINFIFCTDILFNSSAGKTFFYPNQKSNKLKVIKNGVFLNVNKNQRDLATRVKGNSNNTFIVGNIARYAEVKNQVSIIEMASIISQLNINIKFHIYGRGVVQNLSNIVVNKGLEDSVLLFDEVHPVFPVMKSFNMSVFPSFNEGQPNALIEAMLLGLPCVVSNHPAIEEAVHRDMRKICLFDPLDVSSFAEAIMKVYNNKLQYDTELVKEWAIKEYNPILRFAEFSHALGLKA